MMSFWGEGDFLLVYHSDLRSRWNCCQVISHRSQQNHNHQQQEECCRVFTELFVLRGTAKNYPFSYIKGRLRKVAPLPVVKIPLECFDTIGLESERASARKKIERWGTGMVICLECGANDLHMVQLMPLPPIISCFSKIQNGLSLWCRLTQVVLEKKAIKRMVCVMDAITIIRNTDLVQHKYSDQWTRQCHMLFQAINKSCSSWQTQNLNKRIDDDVCNCWLPYTLKIIYTKLQCCWVMQETKNLTLWPAVKYTSTICHQKVFHTADLKQFTRHAVLLSGYDSHNNGNNKSSTK